MVPGRIHCFMGLLESADLSRTAIKNVRPLHLSTPTNSQIMTPVIFSFPKLTSIDSNGFTHSSSNSGFAFGEVQYDFPAKLKPVTCIALIYLVCVFFFNCLRRHFLHYVVRQKHYFQQREVVLSKPRSVPAALCGVASFVSLPFSATSVICLWRSHFSRGACCCRMWEKTSHFFNNSHSCKNFTPFSWSENRNPKKFGREIICAHYTAPEGSFRHEGQVLNFVLVSLDYRRERKDHVIGTKILPHFFESTTFVRKVPRLSL